MSRGINKVILIGNTGGDVDTRAMPSGAMVAKFSVATSDSWGKGEQRQERTEWHKVTAFGALAEIAQKHLKKGDQVYVEGSLRTSKWKDKSSGQDRYMTEIVAKEINSLWGTLGAPKEAQKPSAEPGLDDDIPW